MPRPFDEWPEFMTRADVVDCTGIPRDQVGIMFRRMDFPLLVPEVKKYQTVNKYRLVAYIRGNVADPTCQR